MAGDDERAVGDPNADAAFERWRKGVASVLAKSKRVDVSELPDAPESLLTTETYDGVPIAPLYGPRDELPESALPGSYPFVRGASATPDVSRGWFVTARFGDPSTGATDAAAVNRAILDGLNNGVGALWVAVGGDAPAPAELATVLDGVLLDLAPITLDAADTTAAAEALLAVVDAADVTDRSAIDLRLGASPLTDAFTGAPANTDAAVELAVSVADRPERIRPITIDATVFHDAGASDIQEVGAAIAAGAEYLRLLTAAGLSVTRALQLVEFRYAATDKQFETIAKLRAARQAWARIAQVCGSPAQGGAPQHVVTSAAMMTQRDPWVNMLRTTVAAFAAGVGGADAVTVLPFDQAIVGGSPGVSRTFAERIARNTQLLLLEESHIGAVVDPAGGSWYVEALTAEYAAAAWAYFQGIEAEGGYLAALASGLLERTIAQTRAAREDDINHRRFAITGVNEFPNLAEPDITAGEVDGRVYRYASAFEALRDRSDAILAATGTRPRARLVPLGTVAEYNGRTTFAGNLLAAGGIEAVTDPADGPSADAAPITDVAVICGTDKRYATEGSDTVRDLRHSGVGRILVAGPAKAFADAEHRPDGYLTLGMDAIAILTELLDAAAVDPSGDRVEKESIR